MSETGALAHEYRLASELSETLNRALIGLKKAQLHTAGEDIDADDLRRARSSVAEIVESVSNAVRSHEGRGFPGISDIPPAVTSHILKRRRGQLPYYLKDLDELRVHLKGSELLSDGDIRLLDEIAGLIDAETAQVFRRLMRK